LETPIVSIINKIEHYYIINCINKCLIQHITTYNGGETRDYCACDADHESKYKNIKLHFCHNCLFGSNQNIGIPINIITNSFNTK